MNKKNSLQMAQDLLKESMAANERAMDLVESLNPKLAPDVNERLLQSAIMAARSYAEDAITNFNAALEVLYREGP